MILWLASYPRSGNTLTRTLLNRVFGLETYSEYNDRFDIGARADVSASVGHRPYQGSWDEVFPQLVADPSLHVVKTHHPPKDDHPAIYIVRDGRSAIRSFWHFIHNHPVTATRRSMRQLVTGATFGGDWSGHLRAWAPLERPNTLFLRYEDLVATPERVIPLLGRFLGLSPIARWKNPLESQRALLPSFFRHGSDAANIAEWTPRDLGLFWDRHGDWMRRLGYGTRFDPADARRPLWRPQSRLVNPTVWQDGRLPLGPEPRVGITVDGVHGYQLHQDQPCRWTGARMRLTALLPPGAPPAALDITLWGYGAEATPVTLRVNGATVFEGPRSALRAARLPLAGVPWRGRELVLETETIPFSTDLDSRPLGLCLRDLALVAPSVTDDREPPSPPD